jgi:hypothetical protein
MTAVKNHLHDLSKKDYASRDSPLREKWIMRAAVIIVVVSVPMTVI